MDRWVQRVALVTGASAGIGAAICKSLATAGMKVVGCARNVDPIDKLSEELIAQKVPGELHSVRCDVSVEADIQSLFENIKKKFGKLHICVNNAGLSFEDIKLMNGKTDQWKKMIDVNVMAVCICTRESIKIMQDNNIDDGQIININSISGHRIPPTNVAHFYCGTKFMVSALTEGLRRELREAKSKIRVCQISPGIVETEFAIRCHGPKKAKELFEKANWLQSDDIAEAILYVLRAPANVETNDIIIRSVEQPA